MGEYCDELDELNHEEDSFKLNTMNQNQAEENNDLAKTHAEENNDLAKNNAEEKNDGAKTHAEENNYLNKNNAEENLDMNEWPGWGLPPAANPWAESGKPGDPTRTSPAPSPLPSVLNDPIPPWTPSDQAPPFTIVHVGKRRKDFLFRRVHFLFPIAEMAQNGLS